MFNAWRKAWAKDNETQSDDLSSGRSSATPRGDHLVLDQPETTEDGAVVPTASDALAEVQNTSYPETAEPQLSGAPPGSLSDTTFATLAAPETDSASFSIDDHVERDLHPISKRRKLNYKSVPESNPLAKDEDRLKFEAAITSNSANDLCASCSLHANSWHSLAIVSFSSPECEMRCAPSRCSHLCPCQSKPSSSTTSLLGVAASNSISSNEMVIAK